MDVRIRRWTEADAEVLAAAVAASLPELRPWMPWAAAEPQPPEWRRRWIREVNATEAAGGSRTRAILAGGAVAGGCALHARIGPGALEIGYWVATAFAGRGVATAAVRLLRRGVRGPRDRPPRDPPRPAQRRVGRGRCARWVQPGRGDRGAAHLAPRPRGLGGGAQRRMSNVTGCSPGTVRVTVAGV